MFSNKNKKKKMLLEFLKNWPRSAIRAKNVVFPGIKKTNHIYRSALNEGYK